MPNRGVFVCGPSICGAVGLSSIGQRSKDQGFLERSTLCRTGAVANSQLYGYLQHTSK